jgi:hypothetical protein
MEKPESKLSGLFELRIPLNVIHHSARKVSHLSRQSRPPIKWLVGVVDLVGIRSSPGLSDFFD